MMTDWRDFAEAITLTNCLPVSETSALQKKYFGEKFWKSMLPALIIIPMLKALFFKQVQNKMHWAAHKHTAAEVIYERADAEKENFFPYLRKLL